MFPKNECNVFYSLEYISNTCGKCALHKGVQGDIGEVVRSVEDSNMQLLRETILSCCEWQQKTLAAQGAGESVGKEIFEGFEILPLKAR